MRCLVANNRTAALATVNYDISALGIRLCLDGAKNAAAGVCSVAGVYINMKRAKAEGAMIP